MFDIDTASAMTKVQSLSGSLDTAKAAMGTLAASAFGAFSFGAMKDFIEGQISAAKEVRLTAAKLGVSTDALQEWTFAAGTAGVSAEGAANGLKFLNKNVGLALEGNAEASKSFQDLGVKIKDGEGNVRDVGDMLPEVADAFQKMGSQQERTAASMKIFGRAGADLLPLLQEGSKNIDALRERFHELGGGMSAEFIAKSKEAGKAMGAVKFGVAALKREIASELLPYFTKYAEKAQTITSYLIRMAKETHIVKEVVGAVGIAAAVAAAKTAYSWGKVLGLFPKGGSLLKNLFSMGELGLIIGGILLLAGGIEDIVVMCQGGQSVIGDFLDQMLGVEYRKDLVDSLTKAWDDMRPALDEIKPLVADIGAAFGKSIPYAIGLVLDLIKVLYTVGLFLEKTGELIGELATGGGAAGADRVAKSFGDKVANIWSSGSTVANLIGAPSVPATETAGGRQPTGFSRGDVTVDVSVVGGPTNADTGRAVAAGVQNGIAGADRRAAAAALFSGDE